MNKEGSLLKFLIRWRIHCESASLRVASLRVASLRVVSLRVASLRVASLRWGFIASKTLTYV